MAVLYRALLLTSGLGSVLGLFALQMHPVLGGVILVISVVGLLISSAQLFPDPRGIPNNVKEIDHGGRRPC
jgi:hypothetical protein